VPIVTTEIWIAAPPERVFDLSRCIDLHTESMDCHREVPIAGVTHGLIGLDEEVTWRATHFGVRQNLTSRITAFTRPTHFRDSMVRGAFARFDHDHYFEAHGTRTLMVDVFDFTAPWGWLGGAISNSFLVRYMRKLLERKNRTIKEVAESERWALFLQ
jgi:ligand-binding SRPBCC domain-containing protein